MVMDSAKKRLRSQRPVPYVSAGMISAGVRVLRESGALAVELSSDYEVVRQVLEKALSVRSREHKIGSKK